MNEEASLLRVCSLLNRYKAKYLIVGGRACWLHGYVRATVDVDILVPEDRENHQRIIAALSELDDHAAAELTMEDFVDNVVITVADEVQVDVSTRAWKVGYDEAHKSALCKTVEGVEIPYIDLKTLIKSKSTHREQDRIDVEYLRSIERDIAK